MGLLRGYIAKWVLSLWCDGTFKALEPERLVRAGSQEVNMAKIIKFPMDRSLQKAQEATTLDGATAEIIIFPGIRFDYHGVSLAVSR